MTSAPGYAIIEPIEEEGTISVVSSDDKPIQKGKIIEVGPETTDHLYGQTTEVIKCPFGKGDTIFHAYHWETLKIKEKEYRVVAFKDILVKL
jgi:co-chaperonin GroES (HSP10)